MATATTNLVTIPGDDWVLLADGDTWAKDVIIQLAENDPVLIAVVTAKPASNNFVGIVMAAGDAPFSAAIQAGQKVYGRGRSSATSVTVILGG